MVDVDFGLWQPSFPPSTENRIFLNKIKDLRKYEILHTPHFFTTCQVLKTAHLSMVRFFLCLSTISLGFCTGLLLDSFPWTVNFLLSNQ